MNTTKAVGNTARVSLSALMFCVVSTAWSAPTPDDELEQVLVMATKIDKPINQITHSVTVVQEEQIKDQVFTDLTEVLRQQAGLEFKQVGGPGQFNYLKLRGLGSNNVLIVVDGVVINTASGGDTRNLLSQLNPDVIESLEIVRGPQATLYGANATAGVIVIRTKSGDKTDASISAETGSLAWRKYDGSLRDKIMLGEGALLYSANLSRTDSGGIHEYEYFKDKSAQLKLDYETDRWSVTGSIWKSNNDFGYAELDEVGAVTRKENYWSFQTPDPDQHSETDQIIVGLHVDWKITDQLKQVVRLGRTRMSYNISDAANGLLGYQRAPVTIPANATGMSTPVAPGGVVAIYDTPQDIRADYKDYRNQAGYEMVFTGGSFNLLGGLEYQKQGARQWGSYGVSGTDDSYKSVFTNGDIKLLGMKLIVSLGVRLDDYQSWGKQTTGNAGVAWQLSDAFNLYANYGTSFKPATMSQLFNPMYGDVRLKPESGRTAELGVRSTWLDHKLNVEAAYWNAHIDDVVFFDYGIVNSRTSRPCAFNSALNCGQYNNGSEGKTSGIELKANYQLNDAVGLYGNYTYTDSQVRTVNADWKRAVQIARSKGNLGVHYKQDQLTLGMNVYYSGPRLRWAGDLQTAGYVRVDVSGRYQLTRQFSLSGRIENLLDRNYLDELGYAETGMYSVIGVEYKFF